MNKDLNLFLEYLAEIQGANQKLTVSSYKTILEEMIDYMFEGDTEKATFEQDFLIQKGKEIVPIEVKAEANTRSQSLKAYCDKYKPGYAVRFSTRNYIDQEWMCNIPLYAICNL